MKSRLLFAFLLFSSVLSADEFEKKYGRGVVHIQPDSFSTIEFFSAPDSQITHCISILRNAWNIGTHYVNFDTLLNSAPPAWFSTLYYIPTGEYARIDIIAVDSSNGYYRTLLKDDKGREVWIKKSKGVSFLSWFGFYSTVSSIQLESGDVTLFEKPDDKAVRVDYSYLVPLDHIPTFRPLEVKGNWMKVELQLPDSDPEIPWHVYTGWIRWRDDQKPLVKYNLMGC